MVVNIKKLLKVIFIAIVFSFLFFGFFITFEDSGFLSSSLSSNFNLVVLLSIYTGSMVSVILNYFNK